MIKGVRCFYTLCFILIYLNAFGATTGKIAGIVMDAESGEGLPGANVIIQGTSVGAATDIDGHYFIINVPPGNYAVKASMMGYMTVIKENVKVDIDRTSTIDFSLEMSTIEGEEVTVVAERDIVPLDVSSSQVSAAGETVVEIPAVKDVEQYLNMQAGIENMMIRGGAQNQTGMMIDGVSMVDERVNRPTLSSVNLSAIKEISLLTGGFNAEYGNVRSGMISIVTKEGGEAYHGSIDYRFSPAAKKHFGPSWYSMESYHLRPYLDPQVAWEGTSKWDEKTQKQYPTFIGWNEYSKRLMDDDDPSNDRTAEECQELFKFRKFAEGSSRERKDGDRADHFFDGSIGGPVPLIGKALGNLRFFASHRLERTSFPFELSRKDFFEDNTTLKLISDITPSLKMTVIGGYSEILSAARNSSGDYFNSETSVLGQATGYGGATIYTPARFSEFSLWRNNQVLMLNHVLSPSTFYEVRIDRMKSIYRVWPIASRDTSRVYQFGNTYVDEAPLGHFSDSVEAQDGMRMGMHLGVARDFSDVTTINIRADITSQVDRFNQVKAGIHSVYNDMDIWRAAINEAIPSSYWEDTYRKFPKRLSAYVQDKLEIEGMIANFGVRADYSTPATDWYDVDPFSKYFKAKYQENFDEVVPKEEAEKRLKLSPRLGVSHPITENSKIYFNYGHFYSMPRTSDYYGIRRQFPGKVVEMGNPGADLEKTISYELGYDHNLFNTVLLHLAGYYKDVTDQVGAVSYHNYDGSVSYSTRENNNYADIRGFEVRLEKMVGQWFLGWANYDYMVITSGYLGRRHYYEDPIQNRLYGLQNPYQERPIAQPRFRGNLTLMTPRDWGPTVANLKPLGEFRFSLFFSWKAGSWFTYNPNQVPGIENNLQWKDYSNWNARINKTISTGRFEVTLFADITNVFNQKFFNGSAGFTSGSDNENYMESLHLPASAAYDNEVGDDTMGSHGEDYIDMPNMTNATFRPPRDIFVGLRVNF